jgi:hypothetical protein
MSVQAIYFDRHHWTLPKAKQWMKTRKLIAHPEVRPHEYCFHQLPCPPGHSCRHSIGQGIDAHVVYPQEGGSLISRIKSGISYLTPDFLKTYKSKTPKFKAFLKEHECPRVARTQPQG